MAVIQLKSGNCKRNQTASAFGGSSPPQPTMINPKCDKCKEELDEFGAILLSPPDNRGSVKKYHICVKCFDIIVKDIDMGA